MVIKKLKPVRILHIVSSLNSASGVMHVIMNYYRHFDRSKVQFDFLYFFQMPDTFEEEIKSLGGRTFFLPKPSLRRGITIYREYDRFFRERAGDYKAVHLHEVYLNLLIMPLARKYGIKYLIAHSHSTMFSDQKLKAFRNRLLCLGVKKEANIYCACSRAAGQALFGEKAVASGKVKIIHNAIDVEKYKFNPEIRNKIRRELNLEDLFVVGHVGRFSKQKNHVFLLEIFSEIQKIIPKSALVLIGGGPLHEKIREKTRVLKNEDAVLFLGIKRNVADYLQAMDVFIMPSLFEGLGMVLWEAQCSGLPCIVSDVIPEEAKVSDNFQILSLEEKPAVWAAAACKISTGYRRGTLPNIHLRNLDINFVAKDLEAFYLSL